MMDLGGESSFRPERAAFRRVTGSGLFTAAMMRLGTVNRERIPLLTDL